MNGDPRRRPGNLSHLQRLANSAAAAADVPVGRYQRWINTQILSAILDRVRDEDGDPLFTLKGGAAMELRLGLTARATKDYGRENDRFRDLIDLPLLRELLDDNAIASVRAACIEICEIRGTHAWPPAVTVWPSWPDGFAAMAREIAFHTEDVNTAADDVRALITEIDRA